VYITINKIAKRPPVKATENINSILFVMLKLISAGMTVEEKPIKNAQLNVMVLFG
jgi:hypothetical protein